MASLNIISITPYPSGTTVTNLPAETEFDPAIRDVSAAGAGRNQAYGMRKKRVGDVVDINLKYVNLSAADAKKVIDAVSPEYVTVVYMDEARSTSNITKVFYVSDREYSKHHLPGFYKSLSFQLIQQDINV